MNEPKYTAGYDDGSGEEYILRGDDEVLALRWGCSCCKDCSPLTESEIAFRDTVVTALNSHGAQAALIAELESQLQYQTRVNASLKEALDQALQHSTELKAQLRLDQALARIAEVKP